MRQLSGLDASFLHLESPSTPMHVASAIVLDPTDVPGGITYERIEALIESRYAALGPFRWRLVDVPLGLDHPYWIVDPDFDVEFHLRRSAIPAPGGPAELSEVVSRIHARPLDRSRPLWELYVIEGLADGRVAIVTKMHHAAIDGVSGAEIAGAILDLEPDPGPRDLGPPLEPEHAPGGLEMLARGAVGLARQPRRVARTAVRTAKALPGLGGLATMLVPGVVRRRVSDGGIIGGAPTLQAPDTPLNGVVSPHRVWAYGDVSLDTIKAVKDARGATVNDVVMALATAALRRYLLDRDALPDRPLQAMVPISVRTPDQSGEMGNRVTAMVATLPTHLADPFDRLATLSERMQVAKTANAVPADLLQDYTQFAAPAIAARAARVVARTRWADRFRLPFNVVISNVPGPRVPLYLAGALVEHYYPISAIADGIGVNITVQSYRDEMAIGVVTDRSLVPEAWDLVAGMQEELEVLAGS
jgi:diacylglycerol O-acyltransferase